MGERKEEATQINSKVARLFIEDCCFINSLHTTPQEEPPSLEEPTLQQSILNAS